MIGVFLGSVVKYTSFVPMTLGSYESFVSVFYVFVGLDFVMTLSLALMHFLRAHRTHFLYEWLVSCTRLYYKWLYLPFGLPIFGKDASQGRSPEGADPEVRWDGGGVCARVLHECQVF